MSPQSGRLLNCVDRRQLRLGLALEPQAHTQKYT